ncbi:MAG: Uncharacterized protein G01um101448_574 [Parcubacteria group bacterium Gr01-1014_48]|nr:MAG: Uncharacterized protein Greene041614_200 [Parcubacteria group bacterium Greene0416_14]TSC73768.1 MAG: Uncharacterized protein G01um101448_574 [Parcubacteria group bacterium Gr01-1014_48]TSD01196.1 MAG: Uncharacterized protein Greene101415_391 [Parcubacteria group bacterium Greene1014_15]TSD08047.1 MAG: Uncharacterized protein Greene07144_470 [Parcubacteria group bacterium Greene0714_4]
MTLIAVVFMGVFGVIMMSLTGFIFIQNNVERAKQNREVALQIAEGGLDYYRWFLAHNPNDMQDGTGAPGPYVHVFADPEGGNIGEFSLAINDNQKCGEVTVIDIVSTGSAYKDPSLTRVVKGRYARPSIAEFAYILNSNVWAGADREIYGPYHSNGGIRMDGTNHSSVTSSISDIPPGPGWFCTSSFGCSGAGEWKPGVFGAGSGSALWNFPIPNINFAGITTDLVNMKTRAINNGGIYIASSAPFKGSHIVLKSDRTYDLFRIKAISPWVWGRHIDDMVWHKDEHIIQNEEFQGNYPIPANCGLIFVEDDVWLEGVVKGKITVASANTTDASVDTTVVLNNNITYTTSGGPDGLLVVAEKSIVIPLVSPNDMQLNGIFIAQKGYYGRSLYLDNGSKKVPAAYSSYVKRNSLTTNGTIVSAGRVGEKWNCGGVYCSGYNTRTNSYDRKLVNDPPPLTPYSSTQYEFTEWRQEK